MLGKLMKYECKATARLLLPLYGALLALSILLKVQNALAHGRLALSFSGAEAIQGWVQAITILLYAGLMAAVFVVTVLLLIQRFYKNLLGTEGYLMFTLPASVDHLIWSKMLVALLWTVISCIVAAISIMILALGWDELRVFFPQLAQFIHDVNRTMGVHAYLIGLEFLVLGLIGILQSVLQVYGGIAIGHLVSRHRVLGSIGGYLALSVVSTIVLQILAQIAYPIVKTNGFQAWVDGLMHAGDLTGKMIAGELMLLGVILLTALFSAGYYIVTRQILKKKLNLE